jgi:hypothetical protein
LWFKNFIFLYLSFISLYRWYLGFENSLTWYLRLFFRPNFNVLSRVNPLTRGTI